MGKGTRAAKCSASIDNEEYPKAKVKKKPHVIKAGGYFQNEELETAYDEAAKVVELLFDRQPDDDLILKRLRNRKTMAPTWWEKMAKDVFGLSARQALQLMPEGVLVRIKQFAKKDKHFAYISEEWKLPLDCGDSLI